MSTKPLLAATLEEKDFSKLTFPLYASVKLDGIRVFVEGGVVLSRSRKPIRSKIVQDLFGKHEYNGLDGEILYGPTNAENVFNLTTQVVMSTEWPDWADWNELCFAVFDTMAINDTFTNRTDYLERNLEETNQLFVVEQVAVFDQQQLLSFEEAVLGDGYEGVMLRSPTGHYKQGRSTLKEQILMKLKRFQDDEAVIVGFEEKMHNANEAKTNALGRTERSQAQEGMVPTGVLGALVVELYKDRSVQFKIGSGFNDAQREEIWNNKEKYLDKVVTFKHFVVGAIDKPRFPTYKGLRDKEDMSE